MFFVFGYACDLANFLSPFVRPSSAAVHGGPSAGGPLRPTPFSQRSAPSLLAESPESVLSPSLMAVPLPDDSSGHLQASVATVRPPLTELDLNGGSQSDKQAVSKRTPSPRPSSVAPLRTFKKKKSVMKSQPYQHLSREEIIHSKVIVGRAAVVRPLQVIDAMEATFDEREEDEYSKDDDDFDLEALQYDETRKAELVSLMERYDVYDGEQLRLAIRREKKQEKLEMILDTILDDR